MKKEILKFEPEAMKALKLMENTNQSFYLTGKAGAGKSTLINFFISKTKKKFIMLGTTGISALNIGGQTVHSFLGIRPGKKHTLNNDIIEVIIDTDIFIFDEVSMMRADQFDQVEKIFRKATGINKFFGGKQVIFVGDLYQLPPVGERPFLDREKKKPNKLYEYYKEKYKGLFFFFGENFKKEEMSMIELKKVYRQDDPKFINILNRLRLGDNSNDILDYLNDRVISEEQMHPKAILIATTNIIVDKKNREELMKLPGQVEYSNAAVRGDYPMEQFPTEKDISMKVGARIMFTVNDNKNFEYVNGTLGTITKLHKNPKGFLIGVDIEIDDEGETYIEKITWKNTKDDEKTGDEVFLGSFTQFPFKLAFAITIHKVQGKSFDNVIIDLGWGAFAEGQTYVAISRCRSYKGLQLLKPVKSKDIKSSFAVMKFLKESQGQIESDLLKKI